MALDFSAVRSKLAKSQTKGEKKDYTKIYLKPVLGKQKIRIIPWKEDPSNPFIEVQFHKYDTFKKYIPTLANFGESDPILKFREKVFKDPTSTEDDKNFMKNFTPKTSIYVQAIIRGQENLGVRLWELNKTNFEAVASIMADEEEYGDITDIASGRDLIVEGYNEVNPKTGKTYIALNINASTKQTPLSTSAAEVKDWTTNQLAPIEQYTKSTAEELKALLNNFLNPADGEEDGDEAPAPPPASAPKAPAKAPKAKAFVKLEEPEEAEETSGEEELEEAPKPAPKPAAKAPAKSKPASAPAAEEEDDELMETDELSDVIPNTPPAKPAPKAKPAAAPKKASSSSIASKFDALYGEDDED